LETPACLERLLWSAENAKPKALVEPENTRLCKDPADSPRSDSYMEQMGDTFKAGAQGISDSGR